MRILFRGQGLPTEAINIDPPANNDDSALFWDHCMIHLDNSVILFKLILDYLLIKKYNINEAPFVHSLLDTVNSFSTIKTRNLIV